MEDLDFLECIRRGEAAAVWQDDEAEDMMMPTIQTESVSDGGGVVVLWIRLLVPLRDVLPPPATRDGRMDGWIDQNHR